VSERLRRLAPGATRRELGLVALFVLAGIALRLAYVVATKGHALAGDEVQYDIEGKLAAAGHFLWSTTPYGIAHASTWKAPGYGAFVGVLYKLIGAHPDRVFAVQAVVLTPFTVGLTWLLARRLFGVWAGLAAAALIAVYPNAWQFDVRLYSEALANPLTILVLLLILTAAAVTAKRALGVGLVIGALILIRPSSMLLFAGVAVAWWAHAGWRRGSLLLAISVGTAALVVAPWSIRNAMLDDPYWVPISVQSAAAYGVFNDQSAHDPTYPYAWRATNARDADLLGPNAKPRSDGSLYKELNARARRYVLDHPAALPQAFFWNGVSRLWDLRRPSHVLNEVRFEGRTKAVTAVGLAMYWPLLVLAVVGLAGEWRRRRALVITIAAIALAASVVYTTDGGTRYRAPLEPMIVVLACGTLASVVERRRAGARSRLDDAVPAAA